MTRKSMMRWAIALLALALLAYGVTRALSARRAQQDALAQATAAKAHALVELGPADVVRVEERTLTQGLPVSGSLRAVNAATVKARVAGELQGLAVREGDAVRAGQVLARVEATEYQARVAQAQQQADSAKAQVEIAQRQFDNNKALVDQGFISRSALDTSQNSLSGAQATHRAALAAVDVARKGLDDTVLRSPITGQVAQRYAQPGERVAVDGKVLDVVDLSRLEIEAALSAADSLSVRVGQKASLQVEGSPRPVAARVARINPSAQAGSRSVLAYLQVDDPAGLRQGLFAQGAVATGEMKALCVPRSAVRTDKPAPYVQVVEGDKIVHKPVQPGASGEAAGEPVVAVQGLAAGAVVVAGSVGPLREGTSVKFTRATAP